MWVTLPEPLTPETAAPLFQAYHAGDESVFEKLVLGNLGMVWSIVLRHCAEHHKEEAFSAGREKMIELIRSKKFDPSRGSFTTFAYPWITGAVCKEPRVHDAVLFRSGYTPGWEDDFEAVGNWDLRRHCTVDAAVGLHLLEPTVNEPEFDYESVDRDVITRALSQLTLSERKVIEAIYFEGDDVSGAARRIGLGRQWTHVNHVRALERLRLALAGEESKHRPGVNKLGADTWQASRCLRVGKKWVHRRVNCSSFEEAVKAREELLKEAA